MTEKELNDIREVLGIDDLRTEIRDLRNDVRHLEQKLSGFWYKVVFTLMGVLITGFIMEIIIKLIK